MKIETIQRKKKDHSSPISSSSPRLIIIMGYNVCSFCSMVSRNFVSPNVSSLPRKSFKVLSLNPLLVSRLQKASLLTKTSILLSPLYSVPYTSPFSLCTPRPLFVAPLDTVGKSCEWSVPIKKKKDTNRAFVSSSCDVLAVLGHIACT
jgi:hypothetical protein